MTIIGGHQRLTVAMDLGYKVVPCAIVDVDKVTQRVGTMSTNTVRLPRRVIWINGEFTIYRIISTFE